MIDADAVFQELRSGVAEIVKQAAGKYAAQAQQDVDDFFANAKALVAKWAQELNDGKMTKDEFEFLAKGRLNDLMQMRALTQAGIAAATLDATRQKVVSLVITTLTKTIPC